MDAVGPAGLYLSKLYLPINKIRRGFWGSRTRRILRLHVSYFLVFSITKPEANAKTGSNPGTVLKSRGRCLSVNL